ncbi:hypothetical protein BDZ91DRAFT_783566 [Kalaharituber pfeilii]|nr:hypothetical protein BDZ91DRAFT_783566 [Kalaharituber pfeilii]
MASEVPQHPPITATYLDLSQTHLASTYPNPTFVLILDNVFTPQECANFILQAEASTPDGQWEEAKVYAGHKSGHIVIKEQRHCGRIILDSQELANKWLERIRPYLADVDILGGKKAMKKLMDITSINSQAEKKRDGKEEQWIGIIGNRGLRGQRWRMVRLNEHLRFLRYGPGNYFKPHGDQHYSTWSSQAGSKTEKACLEQPEEVSFITFHEWIDVEAKQGRVLLFQQRDIIHSGHEVFKGVKYSARTDLMYTRVTEPEEE